MGTRERKKGFLARLGESTSGAALVEFTVCLPFLLTIGLGTFEFGRLMYGHHLVTAGIRDAGRFLSRLDDPTLAATQTTAKNLAVFGTPDGSGTVRVSYWATGDVNVVVTAIANDDGAGNKIYRGGAQINRIEVNTTVTYPDIGMLGFFGLGPIQFTVRHQERHIGD